MTRIQVPQKDGEIGIQHNQEAHRVWQVQSGVIQVDDNDVDLVLRSVAGSSVVTGTTSGSSAPSGSPSAAQ